MLVWLRKWLVDVGMSEDSKVSPNDKEQPDGTIKTYYRLMIYSNSTNNTILLPSIQEALVGPYNVSFDDECEMLFASLSAEDHVLPSNIDKLRKTDYSSLIGLYKTDDLYPLVAVVAQ